MRIFLDKWLSLIEVFERIDVDLITSINNRHPISHGAGDVLAGILYHQFSVMANDMGREPATQLLHRSGRSAYELPREVTRQRVLKRAADIIISSFGILVLSPLMLLVAVIVRLDSPGPILFRQIRKGLNGQPFRILKFRTMFVMEDGEVVTQAVRKDTRVTRIGRWLRRASIDELPQLVNVLRGDMSIVGPRPHALAHDNEYKNLITNYERRHHVKPGITGWAQVNGFRGETTELILMHRRVAFDLWYIANWSLVLDFWILIRTCFELLRARNAF
jgi:exopolysaccharide biosynthesis polyprenyl glycosylphosphotransferase